MEEKRSRSSSGRERSKKKLAAPISFTFSLRSKREEAKNLWARRLGSTTLTARVALAPWRLRLLRRRRQK